MNSFYILISSRTARELYVEYYEAPYRNIPYMKGISLILKHVRSLMLKFSYSYVTPVELLHFVTTARLT